jgi:hypothetical protein
MDIKIKEAEVYEPVIRYITTDGEKFNDQMAARNHQYNLEIKDKGKKCYKKYGIMTNMEILAASEQITKEFPAILSYLIPGFSTTFYDYVALNVKAIDQINEIFDAFKDEMSEEEKDSLMESFVINGKFPCTFIFFQDCISTRKFDWICLENEIEKMRKAVIDAKNELSLNI